MNPWKPVVAAAVLALASSTAAMAARTDLVLGMPFKFGVGYSLAPEGRVCSWGGTGGSTVIIDADRRITFAYVMNRMAPAAVIAPALAERLKDIVNR